MVRGPVVSVGERRTVETRYGDRELCEVRLRPHRGEAAPVAVTLWGDWAETADYLGEGMELLVTDPAVSVDGDDSPTPDSYEPGDHRYATAEDSYVVVEPRFLVDVTAVRSWVQCPRMYYLNKLDGVPLKEPVTTGTVVHEVFDDLLRGRDVDEAVDDAVAGAGLELGLLGADPDGVRETVRAHARAIEGWLAQEPLSGEDAWRAEHTLLSPTFGLKGRADALRRGMPVELKTGKNTSREPRFHDKVQAVCYALMLDERARANPDGDGPRGTPDTGTLLYTKNATLEDRPGPAKEFSIGRGLREFVVRERNHLAAMEHDAAVPTGYEADAICEYCFEQDPCVVVAGKLHQEAKAGAVGRTLPDHEREYFQTWYDRVERERRTVHREYAKLWEQSPAERADDDRALVDLEPLETTERPDGRWALAARRTDRTPSKIRTGDTVLASDGDPVYGDTAMGRVAELTAESVVVTTDEPVDLRRVDVYPSEFSVDRMLTALSDFVLKGDPDRKAVLLGEADPGFEPFTADGSFVGNNAAQDEAVARALAAEEFALIHGPPGTGKTFTIACLVRALVERGEQVLLSAFTNRAVDNCVAALADQGFTDVLRMGTESGVRGDLTDRLLDDTLPAAEQAAALDDAPVIAATTATCGSRAMRAQSFDVAVVDEASQLTEPDALAAVNRADRFVLVGDHRQLPPVVREPSMDASLFERLVEEHPAAATLLDRQYRMPQRVQAFPSATFYEGALRPATDEVASQTPADVADTDALAAVDERLAETVSFHEVRGTGDPHRDPVEADRVAEVVEAYLDAGVPASEVGVVAPFRAQVAEIGRRVRDGVTVDTVDRFQGSSAAVVVVSFVATGSLDGPIFEDERRLNVALTRAEKALVLVGDREALTSADPYARMVEWAELGR
ncbi:MAG: AAA domain-containing protein [Halobacteriaceae archaeon]